MASDRLGGDAAKARNNRVRHVMKSALDTNGGVPLDGDLQVLSERGLQRFKSWLLALPAQHCCILNEADGQIDSSLGIEGQIGGSGSFDAAVVLLGLNHRESQPSRKARLSVGFDAVAQNHLLWIVTPVEAEPAGLLLQVSLLAGNAALAHDLPERLRVAQSEPTTRHSTTQPLTALSFLLENLLYAFLESTPDEEYLRAKQIDLLDQVSRLSALMVDAEVFAPAP